MDHDGISKKRATLIVPNQLTEKLGDEWIDLGAQSFLEIFFRDVWLIWEDCLKFDEFFVVVIFIIIVSILRLCYVYITVLILYFLLYYIILEKYVEWINKLRVRR